MAKIFLSTRSHRRSCRSLHWTNIAAKWAGRLRPVTQPDATRLIFEQATGKPSRPLFMTTADLADHRSAHNFGRRPSFGFLPFDLTNRTWVNALEGTAGWWGLTPRLLRPHDERVVDQREPAVARPFIRNSPACTVDYGGNSFGN